MTVTAVAAKVAYNHYQEVADKVLKSGAVYERISNDSHKSVRDAFYMMGTKKDRDTYLALFSRNAYGTKNMKTIRVSDNIKVASRKNAKKILEETLNDEYNKKMLTNKLDRLSKAYRMMGIGTNADKVIAEGYVDLKAGKITDKVYDAANIALVDTVDREFARKYYNALRKAGYGAIQDVNDRKYSGFKSKNPLIVFDSAKVTVDSVRNIQTSEIDDAVKNLKRKALTNTILNTSAKVAVKTAAGIGGVEAFVNVKKNRDIDKFVERYYKSHPGSKLSRAEVAALRYSRSVHKQIKEALQ